MYRLACVRPGWNPIDWLSYVWARNFGHNIALEVKGHIQLAYMYLPMGTSVALDIKQLHMQHTIGFSGIELLGQNG